MNQSRTVLLAIMLAVLIWGTVQAVGAYTLNHNPLRPLVVMACVLGFLGLWALMLANRQARLARRDSDRDAP